jgi:hypothetical protein
MHAVVAYYACMNSIQYTIRSVPLSVDGALRRYAKQRGTSLNDAIIQALQKATGAADIQTIYHDLDGLFGKGIDDKKSFDESSKRLSSSVIDIRFRL